MRPSIYNERQRRLRASLRAARLSRCLTQAEVASTLGLPQSTINKYESGERRLDAIEFIDLCAALGIDPRDIVGRLLVGE